MSLPLSGLRVIELGQLIAGPFASKILAEFGADVIKIEPPKGGDPLRTWRLVHDGTSVWWAAHARNKRSVTLDLRQSEGQEVIRKLAQDADILIENFRPGAMEKWGLGFKDLHAINPKLIMLRVSGYGQTGPYRDRPGFGVIGEAMGGLRYLSGEPGRPPVRVGVSIGDTLSGLHGVIGVMMALRHREQQGGLGQEVDVALYESVFNMMESLLPEYSKFGVVRQPSGASMPGIVPTNAYLCQDGRYALIAGNGDSIYKRLMEAIGRADLAADPRLANNIGRAAHAELIDDAISAYTRQFSLDAVLEAMNAAGVPAGKSYDAADIANDPHYQARDMILEAALPDGSTVQVPGIVPKLSQTPGQVTRPAPELGQHTGEVLDSLGISASEQAEWKSRGII
ncbi:CaiB/BaiF CoA-transferase family protein [Zwartia sp.]|uniref:CaiB/BaiF CoA transferase family protein n=1 Tax=Zwartia sp. TaxID=2978004 RepID=UPI00271D02D3|nr:CaiB/BaiF CoA-transferase family protein [Zwartia sp.]MDO9023889.1 CaiB/BaiF CoA-transferase family protein [Zwartia sp.]